MKEGYKLKDRFIILEYHLRGPIHFFNFLRGKKNSRELRGNVYIKNQYGLFFCGKNFSSVLGASSTCEPEVRREFDLNKGVAIDIGANCGMFTVQLAKILENTGQVISIEPERKNIALLRKNVEINKLRNVSVVEKGVYSKKGQMVFYLDDFGTGGHSLVDGGSKKKEVIQIDTIDNIVKNLGKGGVNLIKIDVEGVELEAFKGANETLKKFHPKIIFEAVEEGKKKEIEGFLSQYGYKIRKIGDWNYVAKV